MLSKNDGDQIDIYFVLAKRFVEGAGGNILRNLRYYARTRPEVGKSVEQVAEIYHTQLNPTVSYLHAPFERRFSLALDVAEIFKPILVDRVIFKLVNLGQLKDKHFEGQLGDILLSEKGRRLFLEHSNRRLEAPIQHKGLKRKVSYRRLIRLERGTVLTQNRQSPINWFLAKPPDTPSRRWGAGFKSDHCGIKGYFL